MKHGKFLSNTYDPREPDAKRCHIYSHHAVHNGQTAIDFEWEQHMKWINANVIDRPKATKKYTTEQLEKNGLVGIYAPVESEDSNGK